jgi:2-(1,2-epoxy-1,2-dihydrophenyl)acetyl-CoA isomerase
MSETTVLHERRDGYAVVTLNRPSRLNAFNEVLHGELKAALETCAAERDCRAIVLTGAGRAFSAGQDLVDGDPTIDFANPDLGLTLETYYNPLIRMMRAMEKPIVAAVNGPAAGAGANIALSCDIVLAARSAYFQQVFTGIGLIPDSGGTWWLTRHLGEARAKGLALTAERLPAEKAEEWGLIWRVVDDAALMAEAEALAQRLANGPARAYALTKQAIQQASEATLDQQLDAERQLQLEAGRSDDFREGVAAFLEKRKPVYRR